VLLSGNTAEPERTLLRRWCEEAAANGGSFSIKQEWTESQWFTTYTINWPDGVDASATGRHACRWFNGRCIDCGRSYGAPRADGVGEVDRG
jgi:hypothetical protein